MANHKKFRGTPKVGRDRPVDLPYPAQLGRGHLAAGSPLAHVAQLRRSPNFRRSSKLLVVFHPGDQFGQVGLGVTLGDQFRQVSPDVTPSDQFGQDSLRPTA